MVQKGNFKDILVMKGMGRVDDTRPIDCEMKTPGCARGSKELKRCIEKTTPFDVR